MSSPTRLVGRADLDITKATSASTSTFVTALVFNVIIFAIEIAIFTLLRPHFKAVYEPRTYVGEVGAKIDPLIPRPSSPSYSKTAAAASSIKSIFLWPVALFRADWRQIIAINGIDAYLYVRFLRMMVRVLIPMWIISWAILLPLSSAGMSSDIFDLEGTSVLTGLNRFTFGNIGKNYQSRLWAHVILVWIFTIWVLFNIRKEMSHFLYVRQQHLISKKHRRSVQARTILVTGIPPNYLSKAALLKVFSEMPGGVERVWINRKLDPLAELYDRRMKACNKLEGAETKLLKLAAKLGGDVPRDKRPTHKLGFLGLWGEKVDTIDWSRNEISVCNQMLEEGKESVVAADERSGDADHATGLRSRVKGVVGGVTKVLKHKPKAGLDADILYPKMNSAFITFHKQIGAHLAVQALAHHGPYKMASRYIEVAPSDVIWANLHLNPYEQKIRIAISAAATVALIVFWSIPVAFVGVISNIQTVCDEVSWLNWICTLPKVVVGIISGILPPVLLAVLMMLLPIVLRLFARFEGIPKYTGLELSLMHRYFGFLVIHSFLVVSLSSGVTAGLQQLLNNPTSIPGTLAQSLPQASIFFLTYVILQGLAGAAAGFLQIATLVVYYVKLFILGSTPRAIHNIKYTPGSASWGTLFPATTLLAVITFGYSIIAPIITGLSTMTFFLFFALYKYLFLYVYRQRKEVDTGGLFFPRAMQHLFVGLYVELVCLAALFFLARDANDKASCIPQGALTIVLIVLTAGFHIVSNNSYDPLLVALPLSLKDRVVDGIDVDGEPLASPQRSTAKLVEERGEGNDIRVPRTSKDGNAVAGDTVKGHRDSRDLESGRKSEDVDRKRGLVVEEDRGRRSTSKARKSLNTDRPDGVALSNSSSSDDSHSSDLVDLYGFAHPAVSRPQRTVWIPRDETIVKRGVETSDADEESAEAGRAAGTTWSERELIGCRDAGVDASVEGAVMDARGKIEVTAGSNEVPGSEG